MWTLLVLLLASMAAVGAYLGDHGFRHGRWGGYAVLYAIGVAGTAAWTQWAGLSLSIRFEAVFGFVLIGAALWGMALLDVIWRGELPRASRVAYLVLLLVIPPYGVIDWALDRTEGRFRAEIIALTISTSIMLIGMFAVNAWWALHELPVVGALQP